MLNEAFQISAALERSGVAAEPLSPLLRKNQKKLGLRVFIGESGELTSLSTLDADSVGALGRYEKANGMTFPSVNIGELRVLSPEASATLKKSLKGRPNHPEIVEALKIGFAASSRGWSERNIADLQKCLREVPTETAPYWTDASSPYSGIRLLIAAFAKKQWSGADFLDAFEALLLRTLDTANSDSDFLKCAYSILFDKGCPVLWEAADLPLGDHAVCSQAMRRFLNRRLVDKTVVANSTATESHHTEALTGFRITPTDRYPKVSLPVVGPSYFFSSPDGIYCQARYGLTEGAIFPTSQDTADKLNSAVSWLVAPEREGQTWDRLPHDGGGDTCLLVAYVKQQPAQSARLARLFGNTTDSLQSAERFEAQCEAVLELLDVQLLQGSDARIELLVIAKPDPGRRNIVFSESFAVDAFRAASARWNEAQLSAPPFLIELPVAKGERAAKVSSFVLHPARLLVLLNTTWVRGVGESIHVSGTRFHEIYRLFLGNETVAKRQAAELLPRALKHWTTACHVIAQERAHGHKPTALEPKTREFARQAVSALTLLLNHLGRPSSHFMNDSAYHLGRALAYANRLHQAYCYHQRGGSIPNNFLGSALVATAATQPSAALARLVERLAPYDTWARVFIAKGGGGDVRTALDGLQTSLQRVSSDLLAKHPSDSDRAELLLGYMSDLSSSES